MRARAAAVAFDLGGVIVDVDLSVLADLGDAVAVEAAFFGAGRHDALTVGALDGDAYIAAAAAVLGIAAARVRERWAAVVAPSAGGVELLREIRDRSAVLIWSNTDPIHWEVLWPHLAPHTSTASPSFLLGAMKPEPAYYRAALRQAGVAGTDVVFVDDRADNVAAARALGVEAAVVRGVDAARAALCPAGM